MDGCGLIIESEIKRSAIGYLPELTWLCPTGLGFGCGLDQPLRRKVSVTDGRHAGCSILDTVHQVGRGELQVVLQGTNVAAFIVELGYGRI